MQSQVLVGSSSKMAALRTQIDRLVKAQFPILIIGEDGSGRRSVAREIASKRPAHRFVSLKKIDWRKQR